MRLSIFKFDYILIESLTHWFIDHMNVELFVCRFMNVGQHWEEICSQGGTKC
jgi:hypothetical protein